LSADRVLEELRRIAFSDITELFDEKGNPKALQDLTPEQAAPIAIFELRNLGTVSVLRIRLWDKVRALEMLMKRFGLLTEKVQQSGVVKFRWESELSERIRRGRERAALGAGDKTETLNRPANG
jgi:hypothetical protein